MSKYKCLDKQLFRIDNFQIVPIRHEDRYIIMKWRNAQIYHLRQSNPLTVQDQDLYFDNVIANLFDEENPTQLLFSLTKNNVFVGYGGLVHIDWDNKNAEISFLMDKDSEKEYFQIYFSNFLKLIEEVAFDNLSLHKLYTYAFDLRPYLYPVLEAEKYSQDAILRDHLYFDEKYIDVIIHSKINLI